MQIHQNGPLMQPLSTHSSALCIVIYGTIKNLCDQHLICIKLINLVHKTVAVLITSNTKNPCNKQY